MFKTSSVEKKHRVRSNIHASGAPRTLWALWLVALAALTTACAVRDEQAAILAACEREASAAVGAAPPSNATNAVGTRDAARDALAEAERMQEAARAAARREALVDACMKRVMAQPEAGT